MTFANKISQFNQNLVQANLELPVGVTLLTPFKDPTVIECCDQFYHKYYNDNARRTFLFGINPGRFGAGITGINFTDPIRLEKDCGIANPFEKRSELSSLFVYEMIEKAGGVDVFYSAFFLAAICPLGFMKEGKNLNYYDEKPLQQMIEQFILDSIRQQIDLGCNTRKAICMGEGKNYAYFRKINDEHHFFEEVIPLPHPRYIMQYKLKKKDDFINKYLEVLNEI